MTHEQKIERARAATQRARVKIAAKGGVENEIDIAHAPLSWWRARWADRQIRRKFIENFIYVRDAFDENRLVRLKYNDLQADFSAKRTGKDVGIKFRRGGFSTVVIAEDFADCIVLSGRTFRCVPHDPDTESEFRTTIKIMFENLASQLKPATRYYSDERIWIDDQLRGTVDSRITTSTVTPGHESKGRGQTITNLLLTEPPHWRGDQRKAATALIEAAAGGKIMVESTPFGIDWTYAIYQQGKKGEAGWTSHFYQWWWKRDYRIEGARFKKARGKDVLLLPDQTTKDVWIVLPAGANETKRSWARSVFEKARVTKEEMAAGRLIYDHLRRLGYLGSRGSSPTVREGAEREGAENHALANARATAPKRRARADRWRCDEVAEYIAWRRSKIEELPGGERQFQVEYPENDIDCFELSGRPVIQGQYLKNPGEPQEPREGHTYMIGVDSSLGLATGNPAAIAVIDITTGVARMVHSEKERKSPDQLAFRVGELSEHYNGAFIVPERNNTGVAVIGALCTNGYGDIDRLYRHLDAPALRRIDDGISTLDEELEKAQLGFPTTFRGFGSKSHAAQVLEESVRKGWLIVDQAFIDEARVVVWSDNESFGPLPGQNHHADLFMATMIANYVVRERAMMSGGFIGVMPDVGYAR